VTVEADLGVSLAASVGGLAAAITGLCGRMDREAQLRMRAADAFRQATFPINVNGQLSAGAATVNTTSHGPATGYYWSIRRFTCQGFTAGTVTFYVDNTNGEALMPFPAAAVNTIGKAEMLMHPGQRLAYTATGITGTPIAWVTTDILESWLLPWYIGAQRDGS
jgi:hypothetical protein